MASRYHFAEKTQRIDSYPPLNWLLALLSFLDEFTRICHDDLNSLRHHDTAFFSSDGPFSSEGMVGNSRGSWEASATMLTLGGQATAMFQNGHF